jgi:hypothetical protein
MNKKLALGLCLFTLILAGCAPASKIATSLSQTAPVVASATQPPAATASTVPPSPTQAAPTNTAAPTDTPKPTNTPKPTDTETPVPTNTTVPEPVKVSGTGDKVVDAVNPFGAAIIHITGNKGSRYFGVTSYDASNTQLDGLVNTTDPYDGYRPLDFRDGQHTTRLEVKAIGAWTIEILPLSTAHVCTIPGSCSGNGDDVLILRGDSKPDTAHITGNKSSRYFGVTSYGSDGHIGGLVNSTDVYDGEVIMSPQAVLLEIQAIGDWTVDVKTR